MPKILFVDDDASTRSQLAQALEESGHEVQTAASGEEGIARLEATDFELVITDLVMGSVGGLEVLEEARKKQIPTPVLIVTGQGSISAAVEAMQRGAVDFLTKPIDLDRLELVIEKAMATRRILHENAELKRRLAGRAGDRKLLGTSPRMLELLADIERIAETNATVLILGESGTGKELVAEAIHNQSKRSGARLVKVNCAALAEGVLESELFGHERGAYTGAHRTREGRFEAAHRGTIFLDEIGDLSVPSQLKLLRVLQEKMFERVGSTQSIEVDVRVVAATNRDLERAVADGTFREELYYRLSVVTLRLPSLRERKGDLPLLIDTFIKEFNAIHGRSITGISPGAMQTLSRYAWPGNVRELRNCIEALVVMSRINEITETALPGHVRSGSESGQIAIPLGRTLDDVNRSYILKTLESVGGNKAKAARILGIGTKTLYRRLHEFGLI